MRCHSPACREAASLGPALGTCLVTQGPFGSPICWSIYVKVLLGCVDDYKGIKLRSPLYGVEGKALASSLDHRCTAGGGSSCPESNCSLSPLLQPWLGSGKRRQSAAWDQLGNWVCFLLAKLNGIAMLGNRPSWTDLQALQIHRLLLTSCMWHVEGTGGGGGWYGEVVHIGA